jgi:hypothetical protein
MQKPKSLSELLARGGKRLTSLRERSDERSSTLEHVRAALPGRLALAVTSAGLEGGRLTVGVVGAVWASRLRYSSDALRKSLSAVAGREILSVRIRVVPPA